MPEGAERGLARVLRTMQVAVPWPVDDVAPVAPVPSTFAPSASPPLSSTAGADPILDGAPTSPTSPSSASSDGIDSPEAPDDDPSLFSPHPHIFAIGDAADAFGALKAGHTAYWQAEVAARNVVRLARAADASSSLSSSSSPLSDEERKKLEEEVKEGERLERYVPGEPMIKVSLGLRKSAYQVDGSVGSKREVSEDLDTGLMWSFWGMEGVDEEGMRV